MPKPPGSVGPFNPFSLSSKDGRLSRFELEKWDHGKLTVNRAFADLLRQNGWLTFDSIWAATAEAAVAKKLRTDRITLRFTLADHGVERAFFIKRHVRSSIKEYIKPLLRLTWPILGARNEWNAILNFHEAALPTMTPVAIGESGANSFLITAALENCDKLSELPAKPDGPLTASRRQALIAHVARIARTMHSAGLHHQDFYLGHLMQSQSDPSTIYVIDLGRVQKQQPLARRWIVKDLAQLAYSASATATVPEKLRFLRTYLGRRLTDDDRPLMNSIQAKAAAIARHSRKNRL